MNARKIVLAYSRKLEDINPGSWNILVFCLQTKFEFSAGKLFSIDRKLLFGVTRTINPKLLVIIMVNIAFHSIDDKLLCWVNHSTSAVLRPRQKRFQSESRFITKISLSLNNFLLSCWMSNNVKIDFCIIHTFLKSSTHPEMVFTIAWGWMMYSFGDFGFTETSKFLMIDAIATFAWATANRLPGQILGPVPNGRYTQRSMNDLTPPCSGPNRSGSNLFGVGKYSSSMKKEMIGISTMAFFSKKSFLSFGRSTSTGSLHNLLKCVAGLCSRSDSVWINFVSL